MKQKARARNLHACHPIMHKGGVHEKSRGAKRAAAKGETRRLADRALGGPPTFRYTRDSATMRPARTGAVYR